MAIIAYLLFLILLSLSTSTQVKPQVPQSFAFITVTHTRGNKYDNIQKHIDRYATMDCEIAAEMNIVWNNEIDPSLAPLFSKKALWKRPVNFYITPGNSMDWRYKIPEESKAQVFFIIDDDVEIDCKELHRGFQKWQEHAVGNIAPIVTYAVRFFQYTQTQGFKYGMVKERDMFTLGLVGLSFMSRHFMDLYYANIGILQEMRKIVREKNNCDDIGLNWLIQYFYPELETIYIKAIKGNLLAQSPAIAQSTSPTHYPYRSECILAFTQIFGVNVLRYKPIEDGYAKKELRFTPLRNQSILSKKRYFEEFMKGKPVAHQLQKPGKSQKEQGALVQNTTEVSSLLKQLQVRLSEAKVANSKLQMQLNVLKKSLEVQKNSQRQTYSQLPRSQSSFNEILLYCVFGLIMAIIFLVYKMLKLSHEKQLIQIKHNQMSALDSSPHIEDGAISE